MLSCLLNGERINCYDGKHDKEQLKKWAKKKILICPVCGKPYEYCHGKVKSPYFRHMDKDECVDRYSEPETEEHINGKRDLYEWLKKQPSVTDCILEGWIPATKQRPDIMFKYNDEQYVLEYQCTPISSEYYERHELYRAAGIKDIWVLGTDKYLHKEENEKSSNFRKKEIEYHTCYYYDSQYKLFISKLDLEFNIHYHLNYCNYQLQSQRNFTDPIRYINYYQKICNLNYTVFENGKITVGKEISTFVNNIKKKYILAELIINYACKYLKTRYDLSFTKDKYNSYCIEHNRLCFQIDVKDNSYTCFEKYFTKEYYYRWNGRKHARREKWTCNERNIYRKKVDKITWNNFIVFVISSLLKFEEYKQKILK